MIRAEGVALGYGGTSVLTGLDLVVGRGEVVALVGGDGAGKTTVLRALWGRLRPLAGALQTPSPRDLGVVLGRAGVFGDLTVAENVELARAAYGAGRGAAEGLLDRTGLAPFTGRLAGQLSGGMRQKLALVMALQHAPAVLLLDEPTTGVDPVSRADLWHLISEQVARGTAVVMATTYLDEAARAGTVVVVDGGRVIEQGAPADICRRAAGTVRIADVPGGRRSWRRGRRWHSWHPREGGSAVDDDDAVVPDLEDAVIVAALVERARTSRDAVPTLGGVRA